jgi:hypothetical protein
MEHIDTLINSSIEKCQTSAHRAKAIAGDLRNNGFDGELVGQLIGELENALQNAHMYQAYINTLVEE